MAGLDWTLGLIPVVIIVFFVLLNSVRILREYERAVVFRFGRQARAILNPGGEGSGPGLILLIPFVDKMVKVSLRTVLGQQELDDLLASREKINEQLTRIIDQHTNPWGVKVAVVEVKNVDLPQDMQRAMSKQAEAERERRAKVINAEGEFQAAAKLAEAADVLTRYPIAIQLRYLQTMREIASERNTTTFFPLPIDLFTPLLRALGAAEPPKK